MLKRLFNIDKIMLIAVLMLLVIGLVVIYSTSGPFAEAKGLENTYFLFKHLKMLVVGLCVVVLFLSIDYKYWYKLSRIGFVLSIIVLIIVLIMGKSAHGAVRWIQIGSSQFQPSEFAKIAVIMFFATKLSELKEKITEFKYGLVLPMVYMGIIFILIILQPNYSTASSLLLVTVFMMFIAGTRAKHLSFLALLGIPAMGALALFSPYRLKRIMALFSPDENVNSSYQQLQSLISLGKGGLFGTGLGESTQKLGFLPMPFTDTIYAILGEELGFLGTSLVLVLFGVVIWRGIVAAYRSETKFGALLAMGLTSSLAINVFMHVGVCIRALPATGQPLPLISFGGTNLLASMAIIGILLNISNSNMGKNLDVRKINHEMQSNSREFQTRVGARR